MFKRAWKWLSAAVGLMLTVLGLAGIPSEVAAWSKWLSSIVPHLYGWGVRLAMFLMGLAILMIVDIVPWFRRRIRVEFWFDSGFGPDVRLTVKNLGASAEFMASAEILDIREPANNQKRLRSFTLSWLETGREKASIPSGLSQRLLLTTVAALDQQNQFHEMRLWEFTAGGMRVADWFRWKAIADEPPEITVKVTVARVSPPSKPREETFVIMGGKYGGIGIRRYACRRARTLSFSNSA